MLINKTTGKKIIQKTRIANTMLSRAKGLMLEKNIDFALIFVLPYESRLNASIHMMFMHHAIDVAFLDSEKKVVDLVHELKPWTLNYTPRKAAKYIVELPAKKAKGLINLDDKLEWK